MSMRCIFFETEPWEQEYFTTKLNNLDLQFFSGPADTTFQDQDAEIISPFIYSHLDQTLLSHFPKLRLIATRSTGIDHIDQDYCNQHKITIVNVPSYGVDTIAEHTFALILALSRKIIPSVERTKKGSFQLTDLRGFSLRNKVLGVVGTGSIGKRVLELAHAFGMKSIVVARHQDQQLIDSYGVRYVDLPTLISLSDIITIHVPATPETHHLINTQNSQLIKPGAILINTARGSIIETEAIVQALEQGRLAGVGLDVLEEEHALKEERQLLTKQFTETADLKIQLLNHVLLNRDDVIITPHNAFNSQEALQEILDQTINNIELFISPEKGI